MFNDASLKEFLNRFDASMQSKLMDAYIQSLDKNKNACIQACENNDLSALHIATHDIKSLALTIGDNQLGEMAKDIEENAINGNSEEAFAKVSELYPLIDNIVSLIKVRS